MKPKVLTTLRIIFCILAVLSAAASVPVGIFAAWWCLIPIAAGAVFALFMIMAKRAATPPEEATRTDFMNTDEQNEQIRNSKNNENK